ncbi:alpha/beta hydrolase [Pollutibacter soli]|uniref:alpha/beta fold hydrolase n=1 Tax=Pollutibacter soli TaxID=3034157 RepID=UPI0030134E08
MEYSAAQWFRKGSFFNYGKHRIFYCTEGAGTPIVLLHGFPTSSFDWSKIWNTLTQRYQLVALDFMGYGFSDKPVNYNYTIKDNAAIVQTLLKNLKIDQYHLLTHDVGDSVAQELFALQQETHQHRIVSCCLLNGGLFPETHRPTTTQKLLLGPLGFLFSKMGSYKKFRSSFSVLFPETSRPSESEMKALYDLILYNGGNKITHLLIKYITERKNNRERWVSALQNASCPLLLIDGISDPVSGKHMVSRYRELVPQSSVVEIENCGHYPQIEFPGEVLKHYSDFMSRHAF